MSRNRILLALLSGVLAVVLGLAWWSQRGPQSPQGAATQDGTVATWSPSAGGRGTSHTGATASPSGTGPAAASASVASGATPAGSASPFPATGSTSSVPAGCATRRAPITPRRFRIPSLGVDSPVLALGLADDGSAATPPLDQPRTVGWFNRGPRPGSSAGKVVLTAHTFHAGGALGNQLFDQATGLRPGAVIQLSDGSGNTQCFRYTRALKVMVSDYDPASGVIYDATSAPMLALVICWDYQPGTKSWASRIIFYATPLAA